MTFIIVNDSITHLVTYLRGEAQKREFPFATAHGVFAFVRDVTACRADVYLSRRRRTNWAGPRQTTAT